jgi:hypothetical protein
MHLYSEIEPDKIIGSLHKKSTLEKKNKTLQKRIERLKKQQTVNLNKTSEEDDADASSMDTEESFVEMTPRSSCVS